MDDLIPTRTTLLHRLKDWQDQSSWQDFFDIYWKLIYSFAIKSGLTATEAQDVVQETMISVAKHIPTFKYDPAVGSFKSWLLNMTRWRILDQFRRREPSDENCFSGETEIGTRMMDKIPDPMSPRLQEEWDVQWEESLFEAAVAKVKRQVDPQKYQMFDFYVYKEWPPEKVAETFGIAIEQVYLAKHRVTEMIKQEVERLKVEMV